MQGAAPVLELAGAEEAAELLDALLDTAAFELLEAVTEPFDAAEFDPQAAVNSKTTVNTASPDRVRPRCVSDLFMVSPERICALSAMYFSNW